MSAPQKGLNRRLSEMRGAKSFLVVVVLLLIYTWASSSLGISLKDFSSADTWREMSDIVIRMGPFHRINSCKNAEIVWGDDEPLEGKPNPAKVKAVCEEDATFYFYDFDLLKEQLAYTSTVWGPLQETFRMAILGTFIGALLAVPFSLLGARNLVKSNAIYYSVRLVMNLIRTIPDLVLAAVLTGIFGLGVLPGVLALGIFSFALIAKLASESIEAIDKGPLEAMQAVGAAKLQQIRFGVVPQVLPQYLAYTLYVLEVNVRASMILGLVGAGGIGYALYTDLNVLRFRNVGVIVAVLLLAVVAVDWVSTKLRERLV